MFVRDNNGNRLIQNLCVDAVKNKSIAIFSNITAQRTLLVPSVTFYAAQCTLKDTENS